MKVSSPYFIQESSLQTVLSRPRTTPYVFVVARFYLHYLTTNRTNSQQFGDARAPPIAQHRSRTKSAPSVICHDTSYTSLSMDHTERMKASFCDLPLEIWESIAVNLDLPDYLHFRALCRRTASLFGRKALISPLRNPRLKNMQALGNNHLEMQDKDKQFEPLHLISRSHILSQAYQENGLIPEVDGLAKLGASLKYIPCGDMVERAACSRNYKELLSWLIKHGASFQEVPGGINRLCLEAYEQGDWERFRWLFHRGGSLDILAGEVFHYPGSYRPRSRLACRSHRVSLKMALKEGARPDSHHEAWANVARSRRLKYSVTVGES
ncbi:hypothetical protein N7468_009839 [Penicillium chermesinum]|uniref:F-box domain-containing protein n=1 Tax=Penicillium chermesinum TaxID=63820 RepID=A0A9W9TBV7_9EURO|nr:uncharacterized protein N7468_009839 [Penicillium chermesinum]KAJ5216831.1 hypothetical protein N7468_009839 [Penicillium chermesinum]